MRDLRQHIPKLNSILNLDISNRLIDKISAILSEEVAYVADELIELAEEVLLQIAAVGITHYLKESSQKEIYE